MHILGGHLRQRDLQGYLRTWSDYQRTSVRGMNRWRDRIDWIVGFPYDRATVEVIVDTFAANGFRLAKPVDRRSGYGCNEFVFRREAAKATSIDQPSVSLVAARPEAINGAFIHQRGKMWQVSAPQPCRLADNASAPEGQRSPVFIFEDDRQIALPHSLHDDIRRRGEGRFSHWDGSIYFSTSDCSDPSRNGRLHRLTYPQSAARFIEAA